MDKIKLILKLNDVDNYLYEGDREGAHVILKKIIKELKNERTISSRDKV